MRGIEHDKIKGPIGEGQIPVISLEIWQNSVIFLFLYFDVWVVLVISSNQKVAIAFDTHIHEHRFGMLLVVPI